MHDMLTALALRKALGLVGVGQVGLPVVLAEHLIHALLDILQGEVSADLSLHKMLLILGECGTLRSSQPVISSGKDTFRRETSLKVDETL